MEQNARLQSAFWMLRLALGATAFLAGADKFTNQLTNWEKYLAPQVRKQIPMSNRTFMRAVGIIEMLVGAGILSARSGISSYAASAWLLGIAVNLWLNE
ncbi:MAG: DoxX family membrane protein, partial [Acidobacteria bacterium]|nr:DoxX family membrane protein [Acidobacteriota bacterium]